MSRDLRKAQTGLETVTGATLAILALASGVYTYLGVRELLNGSATVIFFGAVIYSVAVSVGIFGFWSYLMRYMPHVKTASARRGLYLAMVIGSAMIVAMSSWLNAAALAGGAALEQHLANTTEQYQQKLEQAHDNALAAQSLLPDIELASQRFSRLSQEEANTGSLTGTAGSGTVVQLLSQMSRQLQGLSREIVESREPVKELFAEGGKRLAAMRKLVSAPGPVDARANAFAEEAVALSGTISALQQTSIAPAVKRAAEDLSRTFIAPVADGSSADLANRQSDVVSRVEKSVKGQSEQLAEAADEILQRPAVLPVRYTALSAPEAVLRYAGDFLPSWAGAISIDLLPAVMIFILCIVQGAIRSEEGQDADAQEMTASEMIRAVKLYKQLGTLEEEGVVPPPTEPPFNSDGKVTSFSPTRTVQPKP
ncbi:MAG: hypothetical protein AAF903_00620 [Pseudomonadota bacterium]